jgi:adenosylcobinamide-phosphate synthase
VKGPVILLCAFILDLFIGDPRWLPHPVRIIGKAIGTTEDLLRRFCRSASGEKTMGVVLVVVIVGLTVLTAYGIERVIALISAHLSMYLGTALMVWFVATTIATRELIGSVQLVVNAVKAGSIADSRHHLSMIVGRDTENLSERDVIKAALETLAENLSDGVIAPLVYLAIGGFPAAMAYKAVNTLDSMVGYKNDRYLHFGWAAARLDDVANYVPARITGLLIVLAAFITGAFTKGEGPFSRAARSFRMLRRDGRNHTSPNSGIPEAAMAGALNVRMGGPSLYGGKMVEKPFIGEQGREDFFGASAEAIGIGYVVSCLGAVAAMTTLSLWNVL